MQRGREAWAGDTNLGLDSEWPASKALRLKLFHHFPRGLGLELTPRPKPLPESYAASMYALGHSEAGPFWNTAVQQERWRDQTLKPVWLGFPCPSHYTISFRRLPRTK